MSPGPLTTPEHTAAERPAPPPAEHPAPPPRREVAPPDATPAATVQQSGPLPDEGAPLFATDVANGLRARWDEIQTGFVDEPRRVVEQADALVAETVKHLTDTFAQERRRMETHWEKGDQASTEDLRQVLRRYRSFFHRLLSV